MRIILSVLILSFICMLLTQQYAVAELYECTNDKGVVTHHSRVPCPEGYSTRLIKDESPASSTYEATDKSAGPLENVEVLSRGKLVDLYEHIDYGKYTVFLFYAEWCAPCKTIKPELEKAARSQNTFSLKELDVLNWENPLVSYYNLAGLPYFIVYGPKGEFIERGPVLSKELKSKLTGGN